MSDSNRGAVRIDTLHQLVLRLNLQGTDSCAIDGNVSSINNVIGNCRQLLRRRQHSSTRQK